jgi:hypothetical protein
MGGRRALYSAIVGLTSGCTSVYAVQVGIVDDRQTVCVGD